MARPAKQGFDYFPLDVDFFSDEKLIAIKVSGGAKEIAAFIGLLCAVYRNGYYAQWSEQLAIKVANDIATTPGLVEDTIRQLVKYGFFDQKLAQEEKILTSEGIQRRYLVMKRSRVDVSKLPFWIVMDTKTPVMDTKTPVMDAKTPPKKSKVKKNKEKINSNEFTKSGSDDTAQAHSPTEEFFKNISLDEVKALCMMPEVAELSPLPGDCEDFFAYYAARGWMIAPGIPMSSCKDALISWLRRRRQYPSKSQPQQKPQPAAAAPPQKKKKDEKPPEPQEPPMSGKELDDFLKKHKYGRL